MTTDRTTDAVADAVAAALHDAESESYAQRAAAGRQLAQWADRKEVAPVLERLLLDAHDTAVTKETARALLERCDLIGLRFVLAALSRAQDLSTADWIAGEVYCHQSWLLADGRADELDHLLTALTGDEDPGIRAEAHDFLRMESGQE
jgi:hypothetical protein